MPWWLFYVALGIIFTAGYIALLLSSEAWANGIFDVPIVLIFGFLNGITIPYMLALMHALDDSAEAALVRFRPVLTLDDAGYEKLRYQITTLPARQTLLAAGAGIIYTVLVILSHLFTMGGLQDSEIMQPVTVTLVWVWNLLMYMMVGVLVYHTLHQLQMVNLIYTKHTRINLFKLGPLYALSSLTARTAIGIGIPTYIWFQANALSTMGPTLYNFVQTIFLGILLLVTFISPLWGAHRLLEREKQRLEDEVSQRIEATIAVLHERVDNQELEERGVLRDTLEGLVTEQNVIRKLRTWPWRTETVSGLGLAFLLPIIIWVVQRILERLGF
jgi:hypothetical protein